MSPESVAAAQPAAPNPAAGLLALAPATTDNWATLTGLIVLLLTLLLAVRFYHRLVQRIHRSEKQLKELLSSAPFAVIVTRRTTGEFLFANPHAIELLGLSPATFRSQRVIYPDPNRGREQLLRAFATSRPAEQVEVELASYSGRRFPCIASAALIQFDNEDAILGTFHDISNVKESELRVRASEARLRAVFQTVPDGIVVLSTEGLIVQASESCAALIGESDLTRQTGRPIFELVHSLDRPIARDMLAKVAAKRPRETIAYRIARPDGSTVWIEPRGVLIEDPITGQPLIILVLRDITRRREAQDQLTAHAAELQAALNRIAHLQNEILRVCAWTKQVNVDGEWVPIDHYLAKHLGLKVSHGISEAGLAMLGEPAKDAPTPAHKPPPQENPPR